VPSFLVAYAVTRIAADRICAWCEIRRGIIQPSEFVVAAGDLVTLINFYNKQATRKDQGT